MEEKRSYEYGVHFLYENKGNPRFTPKEKSVFHSIRTREFMVSGFWTNVAPTIHARDYKDPKCVIVPVKVDNPQRQLNKDYRDSIAYVIGGIGEKKSHDNTQWYMQDRIYDGRQSVAVCLTSSIQNMYLFESEAKQKNRSRYIVAMRGRNPNNPSERARSNGNYQQRFEFNAKGLCNTLTTVDKDNYVLEVING